MLRVCVCVLCVYVHVCVEDGRSSGVEEEARSSGCVEEDGRSYSVCEEGWQKLRMCGGVRSSRCAQC